MAVAKDSFKGPVGVAISYDDPVLVLKKVLEYAKKNDKLKVNAGLVEGSLCVGGDLKAVSDLPSKQVLLSMLAGVFQAPATKMAGLLNATLAQLGYALEALKDKKEKS